MDIEGVVAVRNFVMTRYDKDGKPVPGYVGVKWCMNITELHKPVLSRESSKILLFKNQFPFIAVYAEVEDTLGLLYAERSRGKLNGLFGDLAVPGGRKRDTGSYWPVQYDFPETYGIGKAGLPEGTPAERVAQQRQLKGYLMFYEQLLADFLSQLTNAHRLYSITDLKKTYHARFLSDIKDIEPLYRTSSTGVMLEELINDASLGPGWQKLYESREGFEERRNRFLDHLLARFGESFNDYALMMYRINYTERTEERIDAGELIKAKTRSLSDYHIVSSERGKAFCYFPQKPDFTPDMDKLWDTENVSGLERRICLLTGIPDYSRRYLYCISNIEIVCNEESVDIAGEEVLKCFHSFSITSLNGVSFQSGKYERKPEAEKAALDAIELGADSANYRYDADTTLILAGRAGELLLKSTGVFADQETAMQAAVEVAAEISKGCNDSAGLHLIEHILLRPRDTSFELMDVCLGDCDCKCEMDPYSFRASVVLPYWPDHFDSMAFRQYFEDKINEEAPAHVMLKVCWLSNELMRRFEVAYRNWIEKLVGCSFDPTQLGSFRDANNELVGILKKLHSEYPVATLHDCVESKEGNNPVILGKTILGSFKN
jgi:hypothetical protein